MDVRHLEDDALALDQVWYMRTVRKPVLDVFSRESVLQDADPLAQRPRHHSDARAGVNRNLDFNPFIETLDGVMPGRLTC